MGGRMNIADAATRLFAKVQPVDPALTAALVADAPAPDAAAIPSANFDTVRAEQAAREDLWRAQLDPDDTTVYASPAVAQDCPDTLRKATEEFTRRELEARGHLDHANDQIKHLNLRVAGLLVANNTLVEQRREATARAEKAERQRDWLFDQVIGRD